MLLLTIGLILLLLGIVFIMYRISVRRYLVLNEMFPGPKGLPFVGVAFEVMGSTEAFFQKLKQWAADYDGKNYRVWLANIPFVGVVEPAAAEAVMGSSVHITKSSEYDFLKPFLGLGLLTSTGEKWKKHRKILTPAFHFKILEKYIDVFNVNGDILCQKLQTKLNGEIFDIYEFIKLYALDNICETAMGIQINAQKYANLEYVEAIRNACITTITRAYNFWLRADILFHLSGTGRLQRKALKIIHDTTDEVIKKRKSEIQNKRELLRNIEEDKDLNVKQKLAFLDILLLAAEENNLSDKDIREEVDTFMFEGHDTISSALSFAIYSMAANPTIQEKVFQEQFSIFGNSNRFPNYRDLHEMKYLEQVIKETLRMYPSVPYFGRVMAEDLHLRENVYIPKGTEVFIFAHAMQRNPKYWPNPDVFNPENFSPEAVVGRHPYATVPFSAGPRNCIGQKFAMLEMKSALSKIIRNFELLESPHPEDKPKLNAVLILVSQNGIKIRLSPRKYSTTCV